MLSFIIPAHNEQLHLPACLTSIRRAASALPHPYEIIVVNDDSTDATPAIASAHGTTVLNVKLRHIAAVRNAGARHATGEYLFFVDADTQLPAATLAAAVRSLDAGSVGGGCLVGFDTPLSWPNRAGAQLWHILARTFRWAAGCFVFVRRDVFNDVRGFSEKLFATEEIELSNRLKTRGPFTILPLTVTTSARKTARFTLVDVTILLTRAILTRGKAFHQRKGLHFWYEEGPVTKFE